MGDIWLLDKAVGQYITRGYLDILGEILLEYEGDGHS